MKSGHVTDHVQKTSAKARHDVHVKVGKIQKWERPVGASVTENEAREREKTLTNTGEERSRRCIRSSGP